MPNFRESSKLAAGRLGPATPLGYFRALGSDTNATEFWIVEREGVRTAIILAAADERWLFEAFPLVDDDTAWTGVSLGAVEVLVDLDAGELFDAPRFQRGAITVSGGRIYIAAVPSGRLGSRVTFEVGSSGPAETQASAVFTRCSWCSAGTMVRRWSCSRQSSAGRHTPCAFLVD
jgi:hypothetical protein